MTETTKVYPASKGPSLDDYQIAEREIAPDWEGQYLGHQRDRITRRAWELFHARQTKQ